MLKERVEMGKQEIPELLELVIREMLEH